MQYYFDNAATTAIKPESVAKAVYDSLNSGIYGNPSRGAHRFSLNSFQLIYETRRKIAKFFNAPSDDKIAFTSNVTMALNMIVKGVLKEGDHVITTSYEHNSVLRPLYQMVDIGVDLDIITASVPKGEIDYNEFQKKIKPETKMIICTHGSNVIGNLIDIDRLGRLCRENDILFVVDAAQTAGVIPIDVQKSNIDILCWTGHKSLYGPQGTGGVVINSEIDIEPLLSGGSGGDSFNPKQPSDLPGLLESGTMNTHSIAGLSAGIDYINKIGLKEIKNIQLDLAKKFYNGIKDLDLIKFYGDYSQDRTAIVAFNIGDIPSSDVASILNEKYGIAVRGGAHCAPLLHINMDTTEQGIVRFSFSSLNTENEINYAISAIKDLVDMASL